MNEKIYLEGEGVTSLHLFVAVLTQFMPPKGDLCCRLAAILATDHHSASAFAAIKYPGWDIQSLLDLTAFEWFKRITLDPNCPQAAALREFVIEDIEAVPDGDDEGTFKRHHLPGQGA